ncbi:albumin-8-like [Rutidosis leptorrhynchoides]|uniref:albumin-8-like n=1 Tax=Rutidosis leptorrhynchoides TaxID=125765 RepID=UPI003A9A2680
MARFSLVAVLALVAIAVVAEASAKTVTITTVEENPFGRRSTGSGCSQQMMDPQMLNDCRMYLMSTTQGRRQGSRRTEPQQQMQMCCNQLRMMQEPECMCEGLKMMMNTQMQQQMMGQMMRMAMNLPMECGLMNQPCQMQAVLI